MKWSRLALFLTLSALVLVACQSDDDGGGGGGPGDADSGAATDANIDAMDPVADADWDGGADAAPLDAGLDVQALAISCTFDGAVPSEAGVPQDLGHQGRISGLWQEGDRILAEDVDSAPGWILWDTKTGNELAGATTGSVVGFAGGKFAVLAAQVEVRQVADGALVGSVPLGDRVAFGLSSDGSYVWGTSKKALSAWSLAGAPLVSHAGDYSTAKVFGAAGQLRIGGGPAGASVVETVPTDGSAATSSSAYNGTFHSWFPDGTRFLTTVGTTNVLVYTQAAAQLQIIPVSKIEELHGQGDYVWNHQAGVVGYPIDIYAVANGLSVAHYESSLPRVLPSNGSIGILDYGVKTVRILHLAPSGVTETTHDVPSPYNSAFSMDDAGNWAVGAVAGTVWFQGNSTSPMQSGFLGCGAALGLAGSPSGRAAVGTASGVVTAFESVSGSVVQRLPLTSSRIELSTAGDVLAASASDFAAQYAPDRTLNIWSLADGSLIKTYPYTMYGYPTLFGFSLSGNATRLSWSRATYDNTWTIERRVTDLDENVIQTSSTPAISNAFPLPPLLSPDGTHAAVTDDGATSSAATRLYANGVLVTALAGEAVGWLDDNRLLLQVYEVVVDSLGRHLKYKNTAIYDGTGKLVSTPALPSLGRFDVIDASRIFSRFDGTIYDVGTGKALVTSGLPEVAGGPVAAGTRLVSKIGRSIVTIQY